MNDRDTLARLEIIGQRLRQISTGDAASVLTGGLIAAGFHEQERLKLIAETERILDQLDETNDTLSSSERCPIGQSENEGRSLDGRLNEEQASTVAGQIGDAEDGNIKVRLIALENLVVALLAEVPESQSELVREMARFISPRPGMTPHRLTIEAARNMLALVERAAHYRGSRE